VRDPAEHIKRRANPDAPSGARQGVSTRVLAYPIRFSLRHRNAYVISNYPCSLESLDRLCGCCAFAGTSIASESFPEVCMNQV
jgi:hypothetical protein